MLFTGHVIASALQYFGMNDIEDDPNETLLPKEVSEMSANEKHAVFFQHISNIVDSCVDIKFSGPGTGHHSDGVFNYTVQMFSLAFLHAEYHAVREGDGLRVMRVWKFLLPIFKMAGRKNYSLEALNLLSQQLTLSPREAQQLVWSRFVNTHGRSGCNKPCDLEMEHLNRSCKTAVAALGANTTKMLLLWLATALDPLLLLRTNLT